MEKYYTKYTEEEKSAARAVEIIDIVKELNIPYKSDGQRNGKPAYRMIEHDSFTFSGIYWNWNSRDIHRTNAINFLTDYMGMDFKEAMKFALQVGGYDRAGTYIAPKFVSKEPTIKMEPISSREFELPKSYTDCKRVIGYLHKTRGIDYDIIKKLIKENKLFESAKNHNVVFVGYDQKNVPKYAFQRGVGSTRFAGEAVGSDKAYAFSIKGTTDQVRVFESAIDALSYLTMDKDCKDTLQSLGGGSLEALERVLEDVQGIRKIKVCTDNDQTGLRFFKKIEETYGKSHEVSGDLPKKKDWNEDLLFLLQSKKMEMTL